MVAALIVDIIILMCSSQIVACLRNKREQNLPLVVCQQMPKEPLPARRVLGKLILHLGEVVLPAVGLHLLPLPLHTFSWTQCESGYSA